MKKNYLLLISLSTSILFSSCYSWFENKVDMDANTPKMNLGELLYEEEEITSLTAPTQIIVSQGRYCDKMKVHWNEVPYANSYRVERAIVEPDFTTGEYSDPDEGEFEVVGKYVYSNNFVDTILTSPDSSNKEYQNRYYYRVSAENIPKGLESSEFTETTDKSYGWLLPPPASIEAAKGEDPDYIEVRWSRVPQASKYLIYRGEKENGLGMEWIASVSGNKVSYMNPVTQKERGEEFYYKVCAVLSDGSQSAFSVLALGYSAQEGAPSAPATVEIKDGNGVSTNSINVSWSPVTKNDYEIKYSVYRTSSVSSVFETVKANVTSTSITDTSALKPGVKYYYYIQVIARKDEEVLKSSFTKTGPDSTKPAVGWLLSAPSNCEVVDSDNSDK